MINKLEKLTSASGPNNLTGKIFISNSSNSPNYQVIQFRKICHNCYFDWFDLSLYIWSVTWTELQDCLLPFESIRSLSSSHTTTLTTTPPTLTLILQLPQLPQHFQLSPPSPTPSTSPNSSNSPISTLSIVISTGFIFVFNYFPDHPCLLANIKFIKQADLDGMPIMNVLSWPECAQHCSDNVDCKAFSWWPPDNNRGPNLIQTCYLKNSIPTTVEKRGVISGTKDCLALHPITSPSSNPAPGPNTASTAPTPLLTDAQLFMEWEGNFSRRFQTFFDSLNFLE